MPARILSCTRVLAALASALVFAHSHAIGVEAAPKKSAVSSGLDAPLFYQLLIGEIGLREGDAGTAFQVMLDAARKTKDEQLFRRAVEIALQVRAGDQALSAARAWRSDVPTSREAHRYVIQLLVALNRIPDAAEPLRSMLALTPAAERAAAIVSTPRFFYRSPDRKQVSDLLEQVFLPYAEAPATRSAVSVALGRAALAARDNAQALEFLRQAHKQDPTAEAPAQLALEMLPATPDAETIVTSHLRAKPGNHTIRMAYAQVLSGSQRYGDAVVQVEAVAREASQLSLPWLTLGALYLELRQPEKATTALKKYVQLAQSGNVPATPASGAVDDEDGDDDAPAAADRQLTPAWLMLSQAAEQRKNFKEAEAWLAKIDSAPRALEVLLRRASLAAHQGKLKEAREMIRRAPENTPEEARAKILAEAQILRDAKQWAEVNKVLASANEKFPDDVDLLYEQSMAAEKLNRLGDMERLLRRVIELKPDHQHAYNALGYSLAERNLRLPEAKALIEKALSFTPGDPFITDSLGWVEYRLGDLSGSLSLLRSAYQSRPDVEIAAHLGEVLWANGQRDEARRIWREGRSRDAANEVLRETLLRLRVDL